MRRRSKKIEYQEKVVLWFEIESAKKKTHYYPKSQEYVELIIEGILNKKNINTDKLCLGGKKEGVYRFLSSLIVNYYYRDVCINDITNVFEDDLDFK